MSFERITTDPGRMRGQACIRGLRMPVASVVAMVADGMTADEIVAEVVRKHELPRDFDE